ncbi:ABC transporter permease [Primorskyibacter sp. S87]|uniref:ABC transporter permease n=1 Tax=Primorskyibacter sp. S87 TaxID=3415126 RepID=UPI003C7B76FF
MASVTDDSAIRETRSGGGHVTVLRAILGTAVLLVVLKILGVLPAWLNRVPEAMIPPYAQWMDAFFEFIKGDMESGRPGIIYVTRWFAEGPLEFLLNSTANLLEGKRRWPNLGPISWSAIAAVGTVIGYYLGGWRLAALAGGTFIWTALIGQWKLAMQTLSVISVAAPLAFIFGLTLGIIAWKYNWFDKAMRPVLSVLQTLPFFTYLLPAVIFFKVGPTAGAVATIVYAMPPMILMTTLGLQKVSPEVVEAGKMSGCSRWQMLRHVYLPAARTEILVGVNQVIMLCLAMVVLTAFIGMPGLGAKLLAMMNSFKLGRSFEIGVTIVLLAVTLDRLSKAWVVKQPEHFEKGTPWWKRNFYLVLGCALFVGFLCLSYFANRVPNYTLTEGANQGNLLQYLFSVIGEVHRTQDLSQGKQVDAAIKHFLDIDGVQATTEWLRWFLNVKVLIPFRNALLWIPTPAFILVIVGFAYWMAGRREAIIAGLFFSIVASTGWWDRSVITLYTVVSAVVLATLIGLPLAIWTARGAAQPLTWRNGPKDFLIGFVALIFKRIPIILGAMLVAGFYHFFSATETSAAFLSPASPSLYIFAATFFVLWLAVRDWPRDKVMLTIVDTAQTFPSFIYLIPAIMLFGVNDVAVVFSILIFTLVPLTRYTVEGLREVPPEMTEAADMSGASRMQKLKSVQLPLALPTMAVGFNQAIMFAFFMVIIAAFIGTQDLGQELQRTLAGTDLGKNFVLGICVSLMALTFDMVINKWARDRKSALGLE